MSGIKKTRTLIEQLTAANRAIARERVRRLTPLKLTAAQADVLKALSAAPRPLSLNALGTALATYTPPSRLVSVLVAKKLIARRRDEVADRRLLELELTKTGKGMVRAIKRIDTLVERWAARRLSKSPVVQASRALRMLSVDRAGRG